MVPETQPLIFPAPIPAARLSPAARRPLIQQMMESVRALGARRGFARLGIRPSTFDRTDFMVASMPLPGMSFMQGRHHHLKSGMTLQPELGPEALPEETRLVPMPLLPPVDIRWKGYSTLRAMRPSSVPQPQQRKYGFMVPTLS